MKNNKNTGFFIQSETSTSLEDELKNKTIEEQKNFLTNLFVRSHNVTKFSAFLAAGATMFATAIVDSKVADYYMGPGFGLGVFVAIVAGGIGIESYNNRKTIKSYFEGKFPENSISDNNDSSESTLESIKKTIQDNNFKSSNTQKPKFK